MKVACLCVNAALGLVAEGAIAEGNGDRGICKIYIHTHSWKQ